MAFLAIFGFLRCRSGRPRKGSRISPHARWQANSPEGAHCTLQWALSPSASHRRRTGLGATPARRSSGISSLVRQSSPFRPHQTRCTAILSPTEFCWNTFPDATSTPKLNEIFAPGAASPRSAENQCAIAARQLSAVFPVFSTATSSICAAEKAGAEAKVSKSAGIRR